MTPPVYLSIVLLMTIGAMLMVEHGHNKRERATRRPLQRTQTNSNGGIQR
jgi:hypothetical protein